MNRSHHRNWISLLLCAALMLQGCSGMSYRYHKSEGNRSALKVYPFWEGSGDDKYMVGGLKVTLTPKNMPNGESPLAGEKLEEMTTTEGPLFFTDLEPGFYRLQIYLNENINVSEKIELRKGERLTVRVDVEGIKQREAFFDSMEEIGEGIGEAVVVIGTVVVVLAVVAIVIYSEGDVDLGGLFEKNENWDDQDPPR